MKKLVLHRYIVDVLNILPTLQLGKVMQILITYNETGILPTECDEDIAPAMQSIKETLQHIEKISQTRSIAGKKGAKATANKALFNFAQAKTDFAQAKIAKTDILPKQNSILPEQNTDFAQAKTKNRNEKEKQKENNPPSPPIKEKIKQKEKTPDINTRKADFYNSLIPFVEEYGKELVREFFDYWTEPTKSHLKMRFELQKTWDTKRRLNTWRRNSEERTLKQSRRYGNKPTIEQTAAELIGDLLSGTSPTGKISDL